MTERRAGSDRDRQISAVGGDQAEIDYALVAGGSRGVSCTCPPSPPAPFVNGVRIDPLDPAGALRRLEFMLRCPETHVVNHVAADPTVIGRKDAVFRQALNRADLNVADGMGVVWACRALGFPTMRQRVYGPDFMDLVCSWGQDKGVKHYLYGAAPGIPERLAEELSNRYPGLAVAGLESPPYRTLIQEEEAAAAQRITESGADLLWLGIGTPKQQLLADRLRSMVDVRAILTVGAAFDFLARVKPQAPGWIQDHGLEWAFRLASEPRRLWRRYLLGNPAFVAGLVIDAVRRRPRRTG